MRNVAIVSSDESSILILCSLEWSPTQFVLQCNQWFHDWFFLSLFITFRTNVRISIIPSPCSFFFVLHLEWSLNLSTDQKSNPICTFGNLSFTLFILWFKFFSVWIYFLSKCTKKRVKPKTKRENFKCR